MFGLKMGELAIILGIAVLLFGGTKLPQLGSSIGQAIRNFKKGFGGDEQAPAEGQQRPSDALTGTGAPDAKAESRPATPVSKDV
jgi:TatA/E family protein of Tat protein translocase